MLHAFGQTISLSIYSLVMASAAHKMGPSFRFEGQQGDPPGDSHVYEQPMLLSELRCDLCGKECRMGFEHLKGFTCANHLRECPSDTNVYHPACVDKYLKGIGCPNPKDRVKGFMCPRGTSAFTAFEKPCKGKVDNTRVFHPKGAKKEAKAAALAKPVMQAKPPRQAPPPPALAAAVPSNKAPAAPVKNVPCKPQAPLPATKPKVRKVSFAEVIPDPPKEEVPVEPEVSESQSGTDREACMPKAQKKNAKRVIAKHAAAAAAAAAAAMVRDSQPPVKVENTDGKSDVLGSVQSDGKHDVDNDAPGPLGPASLAATSAWVVDLQKYNVLVGGSLGAADASEEEESQDSDEEDEEAADAAPERARAWPIYMNPEELEALKTHQDAGGRGRPSVAPVFNGTMLGAALLAANGEQATVSAEVEVDCEGEEDFDELVALLAA